MQEKAPINTQSPNPLTRGLCLCFPSCFSASFSESKQAIANLWAYFYLKHRLSMSYPRARALCEKNTL